MWMWKGLKKGLGVEEKRASEKHCLCFTSKDEPVVTGPKERFGERCRDAGRQTLLPSMS